MVTSKENAAKQLRSLTELVKDGIKVAFIAENRLTDPKNRREKVKSLEQFGTNLVPIMYVSGEKAVADGCTLVQPTSGELITDFEPSQCIAIVDGQHRFIASTAAKISPDNIWFLECYADASTHDLLMNTNVESHKWNKKDYGHVVSKVNPTELTEFIDDLLQRGYPASTISQLLTDAKDKLKDKDFAKLEANDYDPDDYNLDYAKRFIDAASKRFKDSFIKKRYLIEAVNRWIKKGYSRDEVLTALGNFTKEAASNITSANYKEVDASINYAFTNILTKKSLSNVLQETHSEVAA